MVCNIDCEQLVATVGDDTVTFRLEDGTTEDVLRSDAGLVELRRDTATLAAAVEGETSTTLEYLHHEMQQAYALAIFVLFYSNGIDGAHGHAVYRQVLEYLSIAATAILQ